MTDNYNEEILNAKIAMIPVLRDLKILFATNDFSSIDYLAKRAFGNKIVLFHANMAFGDFLLTQGYQCWDLKDLSVSGQRMVFSGRDFLETLDGIVKEVKAANSGIVIHHSVFSFILNLCRDSIAKSTDRPLSAWDGYGAAKDVILAIIKRLDCGLIIASSVVTKRTDSKNRFRSNNEPILYGPDIKGPALLKALSETLNICAVACAAGNGERLFFKHDPNFPAVKLSVSTDNWGLSRLIVPSVEIVNKTDAKGNVHNTGSALVSAYGTVYKSLVASVKASYATDNANNEQPGETENNSPETTETE